MELLGVKQERATVLGVMMDPGGGGSRDTGRSHEACFPAFQRRASSARVDRLTGEVGNFDCVQNWSDPSGMKPLPPHFGGGG